MKICHLSSVHPPQDIRIFIKECQSLHNAGHDVTFIVPGNTEVVNGIKVVGVRTKAKNMFQRMVKTTAQVYKYALLENADVYHFHDPELIPHALLLKLKGKKVIYDVHEDVPRQILSKWWIRKPFRRIISWGFERLENFAAKKLDAIVTATPFINERFLQLGCNAVNINNFPIFRELYIPNVDWSQKDRAVCYIGGISQIRGIHEMVKAIGETDIKLMIGGQFTSTSNELKHRVFQETGWNNVDFLGLVDRKKVSETIAKSVAGLVLFHPYPNHINAQPNKMFEYMSAGVPVISSNFPLWKQIIEGNDCGICVNPLEPNEIANAIKWLVDNPEEAKRMGENGRRAVEQKYNWEKESEALVNLYASIVKIK